MSDKIKKSEDLTNISTEDLFFSDSDLTSGSINSIVNDSLHKADDGELFLEYCESESFVFDDQKLKSASFDVSKGFGLRAIAGEATGYAHSSDIDAKSLKKASDTVSFITKNNNGSFNSNFTRTNKKLYTDLNPVNSVNFENKIKTLEEIDRYARARNPLVKQVSSSLSGEWQVVRIYRPDGVFVEDIRPLVRLGISVVLEKNGRQETGRMGVGGRVDYQKFLEEDYWQKQVDGALAQAEVNLQSVDSPVGEMDVVLGPGFPGILLHEAIGHGLEGDFNRKKTSAFSSLMGEKIAHDSVTIVDDGTIDSRRGSISIDDEGTPTNCTTLIENGILTGYMQDRHNSKLMGVSPTGNGRRESYAHAPMPRMTNTYMMSGNKTPEEIIKTVKNGVYAVDFSGGQVDITSGKFTFSCTEAYKIVDGKVEQPIKGATLIGNGPDVLKRVSMVGNDSAMDTGIGTCGKAGQSVPVGVGQPTMLVNNLTVGGTASS
ncbi:MAG: metalloprotease TldD [Candidatus Pelagibacterales bacterium]|jgi:TldD protein|nr:metalloprotease TldD [Pelagibacterales bacterium]MDA9137440.1 metalloprotease TldD [Pelagibacterales bacterium]MDB9818596.1 metalloprotease TldD [Pelagibacterales bacterium]|tara:strand:+ start:5622 stop:7085 length:1464 start_codon:yes stop_codon:yes gene_type:complete